MIVRDLQKSTSRLISCFSLFFASHESFVETKENLLTLPTLLILFRKKDDMIA